jgi:photosystem II oxygen-evolving enhancer protein 1
MPNFKNIVAAAFAGVMVSNGFSMPANAITKADLTNLSYLQVKGTGLASRCPEAAATSKNVIELSSGKKYKITDLCVEPTNFQVEEEVSVKKGVTVKEFVNTKLMTRQTYTLDGISGSLEVKDGKAVFTEEDGIDYAPTTVQLPGGERVPFLFSLKNLVAKGNSAGPIKAGFEFGGSFVVPSYRTGGFLDPKGRGMTTGYDFAQALPGKQADTAVVSDDEFYAENNKRFDVLNGDAEFSVNKVNAEDGEFSGVYVSVQPSDTDMGGKVAKNIKTKGIFFGHIEAM